MTETQNNQTQSETGGEHETHTTALVFLVLATLIICYVILTWDQGLDSDLSTDEGTSTQQIEEGEADPNISSGSIIPRKAVAMTNTSRTDDLPEGLPIEGEILRNSTAPIGAGTQHLVITETGLSLADATEIYRNWIDESSFELIEEAGSDNSAVFKTQNDGQTLSIVIAGKADVPTRIQLDYVTGR